MLRPRLVLGSDSSLSESLGSSLARDDLVRLLIGVISASES